MTPQQAVRAQRQGNLFIGSFVHQPFGFLRGERNNGRVTDVKTDEHGLVQCVQVEWPDEAQSLTVHVEDLELERSAHPQTLTGRLRSFVSRTLVR